MPEDYPSLSADELLTALERAGRTPDIELIRACLERREELTPGLLQMLAQSGDETWDDDDPRWYAPVHAGLLLIAFREPAAIPIFDRLLRDPESENLHEWFDTELHHYGPLVIDMLIGILNDRSVYDYARHSTTEILTEIAKEHPDERERIVEALRAQLPPLKADGKLDLSRRERDDPPELWTWLTFALGKLRDPVSAPQIEALYREHFIDEWIIGGVDAYRNSYELPAELQVPTERQFDIERLYTNLQRQALAEAAWTAPVELPVPVLPQIPTSPPQSTYSDPIGPSQPYVRPGPKIGRNDPCPCGSGRKYKKCHGKK